MSTLHGYVHVPFCRVRCGYCDFNTYTATELEGYPQSSFLSNLSAEIELSKFQIQGRQLSTVFFGGGTPTLLPAKELAAALNLLVDTFGLASEAEVTTEANPDTVDSEYLSILKEAGFNRISFGMQSAVPEVLRTLERTHDPRRVSDAVYSAKALGFQTSVDLIYGAPGETMEQWQESVRAAIALETDHISAYALIVEPATKLARQIARGELAEPEEELSADKYEWLDKTLESQGFSWYELSNWSRGESFASRHNIAYWQGSDWWGFGPGAHSHLSGRRWSNVKHPTSYAKALANGQLPIQHLEDIERLAALEERAMLELRLRDGLDLSVVAELNSNAIQVVSELIADGLLEGKSAVSGKAVLTLRGRLLADLVLRKLLGL